ncbi:MAG TPA: helix-turn-helix domain-containing protein [Firmicutes bacterium]|nr:helix-turn-helix domain-containing protein [Bacillota bacterium]
MSILDVVKRLAKERGVSLSELATHIGVGENSLYRWKTQKPSVDKVQAVADYFNVSTDYLLGRTNKKYWELNEKDEKDIAKRLEAIKNDLESGTGLAFDGEPMDDITKELVIAQIENNMRSARIASKQKFTPKKYRN